MSVKWGHFYKDWQGYILEKILAEPGDMFMPKTNTTVRTILWLEWSCVRSIVLVYTNGETVQGIRSIGLLVIPDRFHKGRFKTKCYISYARLIRFTLSFLLSLSFHFSFMWGIVRIEWRILNRSNEKYWIEVSLYVVTQVPSCF